MKTYEMSDEEKEFLAGYDLTKYDRPSVAADVVVFSVMKDDECEDVRRLQEKKLKILLVDSHIKEAGLCPVGSAEKVRMS